MLRSTPHIGLAGIVAAGSCLGFAANASAQSATPTAPGTEIRNVATVSYLPAEGAPRLVSVDTNAAVFTVAPPPTPAEIEFFRFVPNAAGAVPTNVRGGAFAGGTSGPFVPAAPASNPGGATIDTSQPVPLLPATTYLAGEVMFIRVGDLNANLDPNAAERVAVVVEGSNGDRIAVELVETGPDTGVFFAYINTTRGAPVTDDGELSVGANTTFTATYTDALDATDVVVDTALADPSNRVFVSTTGEPVNGAVVSLLDGTGAPAATFGVDGFSAFPATQTSGEAVTDAAGLLYEAGDGEFRLPFVPEGAYQIRVDPPEGYTFASSLDPDTIVSLADGSFVLTPASFGELFSQGADGALRFDIPLDPLGELVVSKTADATSAGIGDFVAYTVLVENAGTAPVPLRLHDTLPMGFRYLPGTARLDGAPVADPDVDPSASAISFDAGTILPDQTREFRYALRVGAGAQMGDAVNRAMVLGGNGRPISNIARAEVSLRQDLLSNTATVVGRISENACDGSEEWAREIVRGDGVEGVRLYTETGAYTVSDSDGLFSFQGVEEGVHVVQVDTETLPDGFSVMQCEESTRYAGRSFSKFIDVQGGGVWRANFYLERTGTVAQDVEEEVFDDAVEYKDFDSSWIETQGSGPGFEPGFAYPAEGRSASIPSVNLGIVHRPDQTVRLRLNGFPVNDLNRDGRLRNVGNSVMLTRWRGVDILRGPNTLVADIVNADGTVERTLTREVAYVSDIMRARAVPDQSVLVADGTNTPTLAVRLEDEAGRPVHRGRMVEVDLDTPYLLHDPDRALRLEDSAGNELIEGLSARESFAVGTDGILHVPLQPTLRTGKATLRIKLDTGREVLLNYYLEPERREWIVVGLAETELGLDTLGDNLVELDDSGGADLGGALKDQGRVAFFAKGLVRGDWLMTLAVDTDKGRRERDGGFREEIDPNAYYTLYGDRSYQQLEGTSRYPLYLKLEKRQGYALFGDFDTNIQEGRLTAYSRRLSGLKAEYVGEDVQLVAFGAETNQGFALDEIAPDGTSGTYRLNNQRIIPQTEEIRIETRDRIRPDVVLDTRVLVRYLDYTLDYYTGELIFRLPVDVSDTEFNPNVIVAEYETLEDAERNITAGGRAQVEIAGDRIRVGSTVVREDGSAAVAGASSTMVGVDALVQLTEGTELRMEAARSEDRQSGETADALLAELVHTSDDLLLESYYRREEGGFGLGQRTSNTLGAERFGVRADYVVHEGETESGRRKRSTIAGAAYRETSLRSGSARNNVEITARRESETLDIVGGVRITTDELEGLDDRRSVIATGTVSKQLPGYGANVSLSHEQPLAANAGGGSENVAAYPGRTVLGIDKTVGDWAVATVRHEWVEADEGASTNTAVGLTATPWRGGSVTLSGDRFDQVSGRRLGATVGLDQQIRISDAVSISAGLRDRRVISGTSALVQPVPDAVQSPFERNEDFSSGYIGASYRTGATSVSGRMEARSSSSGDTYIATAAAAREITETLSLAGAARGAFNEPEGSSSASSQVDARLGLAWRPRDEDDLIVFNRLDVSDRKDTAGLDARKVVNNVALNAQVAPRWQLTLNHGIKHVRSDYGSGDDVVGLSSWSHLAGAETRYDLTEWLDIGARAQVLHSEGDTSWSFGPSIGISPVENLWASVGYNFDGYVDDDFEAAEYSRSGPFVQIRFKFDQLSTRGLLRRISPGGSIEVADAGSPPTP